MIYLSNIIATINDAVKNSLTAIPAINMYPIVDYKYEQPRVGADIKSPVVINYDGRGATDIKTDVNSVSIYHRLGITTINVQPGQSYGDGTIVNNKYATEMQMLVMGTFNSVPYPSYEFISRVVDTMPLAFKVNEAISFDVQIFITGIQPDKRINFNQEFSGIPYFLGPEYFFSSIKYRVEATLLSGCTSLCDC